MLTKTLLLVGHRQDEHCDELERVLATMGKTEAVARISIEMLPAADFTWRLPGRLSIDGMELRRGELAGIWRRPGATNLHGYAPRYRGFAASECEDAFRGAVASLDARWITPPETIVRTELKLLQLQAAADLGIRSPDTVVTNVSAESTSLLPPDLIVKPVRYGLLASSPDPTVVYTQRVRAEDLKELSGAPVIIQECASSAFHLRVTTVGDEVFVAGMRADDQVDWRSSFANHYRFRRHGLPASCGDVGSDALELAKHLGLGFSAQDWILTERGEAVFLEANPNGQWLFLDTLFEGQITRQVALKLIALQDLSS